MTEAMPTVSVGVPVRNGARYIDGALSAIVAQKYDPLEVVISDNASSDSTPAICRAFSGDARVTYLRFEDDSGAIENFNRAFRLTSGDLFCWAAHDDRMKDGYLQRCVDTLGRNPDAAMCVTSVEFIDSEGRLAGTFREGPELASPDLQTRLRSFLRRRGWFLAYGLMRRDVLGNTGLLRPVAGTDVALLWEIVLRHRLCVVEDALFEYRSYRGSGKVAVQAVASLTPGETSAWRRFQGIRLWRELWRSSAADDLSPTARATARRELLLWLFTRYWRELIYNDLCGEFLISARRRHWTRAGLSLIAMGILRPARSCSTLVSGWRRLPTMLGTERR